MTDTVTAATVHLGDEPTVTVHDLGEIDRVSLRIDGLAVIADRGTLADALRRALALLDGKASPDGAGATLEWGRCLVRHLSAGDFMFTDRTGKVRVTGTVNNGEQVTVRYVGDDKQGRVILDAGEVVGFALGSPCGGMVADGLCGLNHGHAGACRTVATVSAS